MAITQRTRKILWTRAANRCAICKQKLTVDASHVDDRETVLGSECHIIAQRLGGPRRGEIDIADVDGYRNLILLCASDHKRVDDQVVTYSVENLHAIKRAHEQWVDEALDWRAQLSEALWARMRQETESPGPSTRSEEAHSVLDGFAVYTVEIAELLGVQELLLFLRADEGAELAFAYKYDVENVWFAHAAVERFALAFRAFDDAPTVEDHTVALDEWVRDRTTTEPGMSDVYAAAFMLRDAAEATSSEALLYARPAHSASDYGFRVLNGTLELAAGSRGTFDPARSAFSRSKPHDISAQVEHRRTIDRAEVLLRDGMPRDALIANMVALGVRQSLTLSRADQILGEDITTFERALRRFLYEALLMSRVASVKPDDPQVIAWGTNHADPEPDDGLSAVLPNACAEAIGTFAKTNRLSGDDTDELSEAALDGVYEVIGLFLRLDDEDAQDQLAHLFIELMKTGWRDPEASTAIYDLARASTHDGVEPLA